MPSQSERRSSRPLRIAVIGAGGIGSTFAHRLARTGLHTVTAVARPGSDRLLQMRRDDGIVDVEGVRAALRVTDRLDEDTAYDVVIVTLQAHRLDAVLPALQRCAASDILFMFNNYEPERLMDAIGPDRCCFGMPFLQAVVDRSGRLDATIGAGGQKSKLGKQVWVDVFNAAGLPAVLEPDMPLWLRCHAPLCIAFESVSAAGMRRGGGASWREATVNARGVRESFAVIRGLGYDLYPAGKAWLDASPIWLVAAMLWVVSRIKSFRELLANGTDECRALVDALVASANRARLPVAVSRIEAMKPSMERVGD